MVTKLVVDRDWYTKTSEMEAYLKNDRLFACSCLPLGQA